MERSLSHAQAVAVVRAIAPIVSEAGMRTWTGLAALLLVAGVTIAGAASPAFHIARALGSYPHDPEASTQGLIIAGRRLFESTGGYGCPRCARWIWPPAGSC